MLKGFKIRIYPTKEQEKQLFKTINTVRWTWNWGLALQMQRFKDSQKLLTAYEIRKQFTIECNKEENAFLKEVAKNSCAIALLDLDEAYKRFFKVQRQSKGFSKKTIERATRRGRKLTPYELQGHPKFKSKHKAKPSFPLQTDAITFYNKTVTITKVGKVKYKSDASFPPRSKP